MSHRDWLDKCRSCKIGTIPMVIQVHEGDFKRIAVGKWVRVKYDPGGRWEQVYVTRVDPNGYFMASK